MKALGGSYLKFLTCKQRENDRVVWCSRDFAPNRQESAFLAHQKRVADGVSLTVSSHHKYTSFICVSASASASAPAQTNVGSEKIQTIYSDNLKTVRVRFKLSKECAFGQHFFIVGEDEILGLWDPSEGVPLTWCEGHVWTAEIDLPIGKVIKYKFILKGEDESVSWQPGPDRTVETWETEKTITVSEDWENHELQNVAEEEDVISDLNEESLINSDFSVEDLGEPPSDQNEKPFASMVAENIATEEFGGRDLSLNDKGSDVMTVTEENDEGRGDFVINGTIPLIPEDEMKDGGVLVLVPGLIPMPHEDEANEAEVDEVEDKTIENMKSEFDEIEDISTELELEPESEPKREPEPEPEPEPKLKGEESASPSQHHAETSEKSMMMVDEKLQQQMENNILESDVQWGRRTIKKFLANLGLI